MTLLQRGDVIRLEEGMRVYTEIPDNLGWTYPVYPRTANEESTSNTNIKTSRKDIIIGETYTKKVSESELIENLIKATESYIIISPEQVKEFIDSLNLDLSDKVLDTNKYIGEYTVIFAINDGGGADYPSGWHVFCQKNDDPSISVDFYQTGCFTAMIPDITPINK